MIPQIEKTVLEKIDFCNKYLEIHEQFVDCGLDIAIFKKKEILEVFAASGYKCNYVAGGAYVLEKKYVDYTFEYSFVIIKNSVNVHIYIFVGGEVIDDRVSNIGSLLRYMPYNEAKANQVNQKYRLNSLLDLSTYITEMIGLCDEFVHQYLEEL